MCVMYDLAALSTALGDVQTSVTALVTFTHTHTHTLSHRARNQLALSQAA